ncbi:MAG: 50S ribosomal protein L3 [Bacteriovoracaceae bacterium]|nr:50S ribosomal protein L3 [Bacteriovoracaceae bacterium]
MSEATISLPAIYGIKAGMTRIFDASGNHIPVTVVKLIPNVISQVKTQDKDGYGAYQVAFHEKRESLLTKPVKGTLKKAGISQNLTQFSEIKVEAPVAEALGKEVGLEEFKANVFVDVTGTSKGKGFQGVMKRYNFQGGPAAHGSHFHRRPGSIGCRATPARVFAEKKMPGQMGNETVTVQNIQVLEVNTKDGYMLIKGSVPGSKNGFIKIAKAVKKA